MARPSVKHGGFIIPNAGDVSEPVLAEPDRIDFNTLANDRWGVLTGCLVAAQSTGLLSVQDGTAMVNGRFVVVTGRADLQVTIPSGAPKFDLVVVDDNGTPMVIPGTQSNSPVLPDPTPNQTVLAAVYCVSGKPLTDFVIDKRKFLAPNLLTKVDPTDDLIRNFDSVAADPLDPPSNWYRVLGNGETIWLNDTRLARSKQGTLKVSDNLEVRTGVSAGLLASTGDVSAVGNVTGKNLRRAVGASEAKAPTLADLWQDPGTGMVYIGKMISGIMQWDQIATMGNFMPPGTIINSLVGPTRMAEAGWLALNGTTRVSEDAYPNIFGVTALQKFCTGVSPHRIMDLPNLTRRIMMTDFTNVAVYGPAARAAGNVIKLSVAQLPQHDHATKTGNAGGFTPSGQVQSSGVHGHTGVTHAHQTTDPGHPHSVAVANLVGATVANGAPTDAVAVLTPNATGRQRVNIDEAYTNLVIKDTTPPVGGGAHPHPVVLAKVDPHYHNMPPTPVGTGAGIDISPDYFTVYTYVHA